MHYMLEFLEVIIIEVGAVPDVLQVELRDQLRHHIDLALSLIESFGAIDCLCRVVEKFSLSVKGEPHVGRDGGCHIHLLNDSLSG